MQQFLYVVFVLAGSHTGRTSAKIWFNRNIETHGGRRRDLDGGIVDDE